MKSKKIFLALGFLAISSCQNNVNYKEEVKQTEPIVQEEKKEQTPEELFGKMCTDDKTFNRYSQSIEKRATEDHPYFLGKIYYEDRLSKVQNLNCSVVAKRQRQLALKRSRKGVKSLKEYINRCNTKKAEKIKQLNENIKLTESGKLPEGEKFALQIDKSSALQKHNDGGIQDCCKQAVIYNPDEPTKKVNACYGIGNYSDGLREVYYLENTKIKTEKVSKTTNKNETIKKSKIKKTKKHNKTKVKKRNRKNRRR